MNRLAFCLLTMAMLVGCSPESEKNAANKNVSSDTKRAPKAELTGVFCLATNWYPQTAHDEDETENRIIRELVRQGVLLAVREEMGLVTRDETLGEAFPEIPADNGASGKRPAKPLDLWLELSDDGTWETRLYGAGTTYDNPVWHHQGKVDFNKRTVYGQFAQQMADMSAEIAESIKAAGGKANTLKSTPENKPGAEVESLLAEMNFVSQYGAVREAHQAISKDGASEEWVGVLTRGYANLALLTEHTWASHSEAFAARALLYAERMLKLSGDSTTAKWHRAYARAIVGTHAAALDQLEELEAESEKEVPPSDWIKLIKPYVKFEHEKLDAVATEHPELAQTVAFLQWQLYQSYQHGRWIYEKGLETMQECPEVYGVYSVMANWPALRIQRTGSSYGMRAFGGLLPKRVATLSDLPDTVKPLTASTDGLLSQLLGRRSDPALSERPIQIARELSLIEKKEAKPAECSWDILSSLIAEEQFVEVADMLKVSHNATEHSFSSLIEQVRPLVEGHRYSAYVESHAFPPSEQEKRAEILRRLKVVDPKGNMKPFYTAFWHVPTADGQDGNLFIWRAIWGRNFTLAGMCESYYGSAIDWTDAFTQAHREQFAQDFRDISPYSPNAKRVPMETGAAFDVERLKEWEAEIGEDPVGWLSLGNHYKSLNEYTNAIRCFRRSLDISPSHAATDGLANCYYARDEKDLWQSTLEEYLKLEDLSLSHAQVHQAIANEKMRSRAWAEAEPHALEAAQTYSAWGLILASRVYEGMQNWEQSEHFVAEATRNYPSYSTGTDWYFWCRRTGRGDIDAAREFAFRSIDMASHSTRFDDMDRTLTYRLLEGEYDAAIKGLEQQLAICLDPQDAWDTMWRKLHVVCAAGDSKNVERKNQAISEVRKLADSEISKTHANWVEVYNGLCDVFEGKEPTEKFLQSFDEAMTLSNTNYRCNYWYFLGVALEQQGQTELADKYLRKSAFLGTFDRYNSALAGHRLVKRLGPERGGLPEEFVKLEEEIAAEAKAKKEREDKAEAEIGQEDTTI